MIHLMQGRWIAHTTALLRIGQSVNIQDLKKVCSPRWRLWCSASGRVTSFGKCRTTTDDVWEGPWPKKIPRFCLNLVGENLSKESERLGVCAIFLRQTLCTQKRRSLSNVSLWTIIIRNLATHSFTADCQVEEQEKLSSESAHPQKLETILLPAFQQLSQKILMVLTINNATSK